MLFIATHSTYYQFTAYAPAFGCWYEVSPLCCRAAAQALDCSAVSLLAVASLLSAIISEKALPKGGAWTALYTGVSEPSKPLIDRHYRLIPMLLSGKKGSRLSMGYRKAVTRHELLMIRFLAYAKLQTLQILPALMHYYYSFKIFISIVFIIS